MSGEISELGSALTDPQLDTTDNYVDYTQINKKIQVVDLSQQDTASMQGGSNPANLEVSKNFKNNLQKIKSALSHIPSDDRDTWIKIGMALHSELDEEGFEIWDEWSQSAASYDPTNIEATWGSFNSDGGISIATLFHLAKENGWDSKGLAVSIHEETSDHESKNEEAKLNREEELSLVHSECREKSKAIWEQATPAPDTHPYLIKKKVKPHNLRVYKDSLVVQVMDINGTIHGLQFIAPEKNEAGMDKFFKKGTIKTGHCHLIGGKPETILYLAEGFATAATIHEATDKPVVVCFDAGNLKPVAEMLREKLPDLQIVICADNDRQVKGNPGLTKARKAALAIVGLLAVPVFPDGVTGSDFNDLAAAVGPEEVRRQIETANIVKPEEPNTFNKKQCWPDPLPLEAMPGLIGEFIKEATKNSEADPAAILITLLSRFAISCGPNPHLMVGDTKHNARINGVVVGESNNARKGTSIGPVKVVFELVPQACKTSPGPLSSGEGIIHAVRDEAQEWVIDKKTNSGNWQVTDPGIEDKRLLVIEEEFSASLQVLKRDGNTLSSIIRTLFDSGDCEPLTKNTKISCRNAHVAIIGHITLFELKKLLSENDKMNGFGNRFLWICAQRTKLVPFPEPLPVHVKQKMAEHIQSAIELAQKGKKYTLTDDAKQLWGNCYPDLSESRDGIAGVITARAAPYVLRLALVYCLFRKGVSISVEDIEAALALWKYADQSANLIFDGTTVPDRKKQEILKCIGGESKTTTEIRKEAFSNHIHSDELQELLEELISTEMIECEITPTAGAPKTTYRKTDRLFCAKSVLTPKQTETMETKNANKLNAQGEICELDVLALFSEEQSAL